MSNIDEKIRNKFIERVHKGLLGPGSENWGVPITEEIISDYPLIRYFTGILFPPRSSSQNQNELDEQEISSLTMSDSDPDELDNFIFEQEDISEKQNTSDRTKNDDFSVNQNSFYPNNMAVSICIANEIKEIDVEFSFGVYYQPSYSDIKISVPESVFKSIYDYKYDFLNKLGFEDGFMFLTERPQGYKGGRGKQRSGDYAEFDNFKKEFPSRAITDKLNFLFGKTPWKRRNLFVCKKIVVDNTANIIPITQVNSGTQVIAGYNTKVYHHNGKKYLKLQLINCSEEHSSYKYSNKSEVLNSKCLFQSKIRVLSTNILPYQSHKQTMPFDNEAEILEFQYRKLKSYGVGHNCSVKWSKTNHTTVVESTYLPMTNVQEIKNNLSDIDDIAFNRALYLKNLSHFGRGKQEVISDLNCFLSHYRKWIENQKCESKQYPNDQFVTSKLISNQIYNLDRISSNIMLLENEDIFNVFRLTNLAMLIQIIISNDSDFSAKEKELSEIVEDIDYSSLAYFENYDYSKIGFEPKYRPFQLAFILLSLDGIVNNRSESRNKIIDLLWFPTGGGKTEAYLAVAAFTIIWRRVRNPDHYEGTSVIMRYTLRLLTAQQFERASRLIVVLEFLRNQTCFAKLLKDEEISIGQWIGIASTPNKLKDAKSKIDYIDSECDKEYGNPQELNPFQVSSCPWCGSKLISKSHGVWDYGFEISNNTFEICCLNPNCFFRSGLPIQVVDEALYRKPPTLLFGTVDKFAMLSWNAEGYRFFNTHKVSKLPPDLIIQDELHLLNGPLGSITGLFENVITLLCKKNSTFPKIIASTATTRNTELQIEQLFGNRKVNIFPPQGLSYEDSFFSKVNKEDSKRLYLGVIPTGKSFIDTQLNLLAHLLVARIDVFSSHHLVSNLDSYWTIVSYFNSLQDVGKISNKIGDEIKYFTQTLQNRLYGDQFRFNFIGLPARKKELTSRVSSEKIKTNLNELFETFTLDKLKEKDNVRYLFDVVDLVLATNMISVGLDVPRLNIMQINGMPRNVAEYIQASSRIGRKTYGLVVTLLNANRAREKSVFEHFIEFHTAFYKFIEPLSVTSFTEHAIDKLIYSLIVTYLRHHNPSLMSKDNQLQNYKPEMLNPLIDHVEERYKNNPNELDYFFRKIHLAKADLEERIQMGYSKYSDLMKRPSEKSEGDSDWIVLQSMREIETSTFIQIKEDR